MDLVVSMGGDHTYLIANSLINDYNTPLLGINTYKAVQHGALVSNGINHSTRMEDCKRILKNLDDPDKLVPEKRSRILMTLDKELRKKNDKGETIISN